jgi:uncharacterized membrane-anchored protein YhcB (DUF1043 family)
MIAEALVHTNGINWESLGTIVIAFVVAVGGGVGFVVKRMDKGRARTEKFVREQVEDVATILDVKLTMIQDTVDKQGGKIDDTRDRVLRIEGKLNGSHA